MNEWAPELKALAIAERYLRGEISPVEACCYLCRFAHALPDCFSQDDRNLVIGVSSETDALPVGNLRDLWHPDFVQEKLDILTSYESAIERNVRDLCERLAKRLLRFAANQEC